MKSRILLFAVLVAALQPAAAGAQVFETVVSFRGGGGMLGIMTEPVRAPGEPSRQRVIRNVVEGSPARAAGLAVGDTILRFNGVAATEQAIATPLEAGDTVVLRIRRGGQERDVRLVAAPRPQSERSFTLALPDSVQRQVAMAMREVQNRLDTLRIRGILPALGDSLFAIAPGDSIRVFRFPSSSGYPMARDSVFFLQRGEGRIYVRAPGGAGADTVRFVRPAEALMSGMAMGLRSVAGAELAELNPALAEYFGVQSGLLVLEARQGTPAERAGIRAGDVITRAGDVDVASVADLRRALAGARAGAAVRLRLLRHGQPVEVTLGG
jgi:membrane-associated protease RseP (regulator of RpoE activity)